MVEKCIVEMCKKNERKKLHKNFENNSTAFKFKQFLGLEKVSSLIAITVCCSTKKCTKNSILNFYYGGYEIYLRNGSSNN